MSYSGQTAPKPLTTKQGSKQVRPPDYRDANGIWWTSIWNPSTGRWERISDNLMNSPTLSPTSEWPSEWKPSFPSALVESNSVQKPSSAPPFWPQDFRPLLKGQSMQNVAMNLVLGRTRVVMPNARLTFLGRARLGQSDIGAAAAQMYYDLIIPILNSKCTGEAVSVQKCAEFQLRLSQCQLKLSTGIQQLNANNPLAFVTLADAAWCMKELHEDVKDAFEPAAPPVLPPQMPPKPEPEGIPWWGWALGAVGILGAGIGILLAVKK